jgi:hypothetical protein
VFLYKIFSIKTNSKKSYLITSIGLFIVEKINQEEYKLLDLFLETTPGRLIFSLNFKKSISK